MLGHSDLVAEAPRQALREDAAESGDERQTRADLERGGERDQLWVGAGEALAEIVEPRQREQGAADQQGEDAQLDQTTTLRPAPELEAACNCRLCGASFTSYRPKSETPVT